MEPQVKLSGDDTYPISINIVSGGETYVTLIEFDTLLKEMMEFRVTYDEKECRDITEEIKEPEWDEEDQAYEAERIAREEEQGFRDQYV